MMGLKKYQSQQKSVIKKRTVDHIPILYKVRKIPGERYPEKESAPDENAQRNT